jgi:hypothetical protein
LLGRRNRSVIQQLYGLPRIVQAEPLAEVCCPVLQESLQGGGQLWGGLACCDVLQEVRHCTRARQQAAGCVVTAKKVDLFVKVVCVRDNSGQTVRTGAVLQHLLLLAVPSCQTTALLMYLKRPHAAAAARLA